MVWAICKLREPYPARIDLDFLRAMRRLERRVGLNRRDATLAEITPSTPTLLVHDVLDRNIPVRSSREVSESWRGARLMETCGLGHQRILNAPPVIHFIGNFLRGFPPPQLC